MPDMIPVKITPLNGEAFRPYGQVLERGALVYPETDEGRVAIEMLQVRRRPDAHQIAQLAIHFSYRLISIGFQIKIREASMLLCPPCRAFHSSAP